MKPKVYLETTIVSYLTAWRSRDLIMAANQEATRSWWDDSKQRFDLFVSEAVLQEATSGDPEAAQRRLKVLENIPDLQISDEAKILAMRLLKEIPLPATAEIDALHIAIATVNGMDYLLTWNCRHIANASLRHRIESICQSMDYDPPIICTPLELIEE